MEKYFSLKNQILVLYLKTTEEMHFGLIKCKKMAFIKLSASKEFHLTFG